MKLCCYERPNDDCIHRWYFVYLTGKARTLAETILFRCSRPMPEILVEPEYYLADLDGNPILIVLFKRPVQGDDGWAILLTDKETIEQAVRLKEQQG